MSRELLGTSTLGRKPAIERVRVADQVRVAHRGRYIDGRVVEIDVEKRELLVRPDPGQSLPRGLGDGLGNLRIIYRLVDGWRSGQLSIFDAPAAAGSAVHV